MRLRVPMALPTLAGAGGDAAIVYDRVVTPLFNGRDLAGWEVDLPAEVENEDVRDGLQVSLGEPPGRLLTKWAFRG